VAQWIIDYFDLEPQDAGKYAERMPRLNFAPDRVRVKEVGVSLGPKSAAKTH
jgi:hypothetical protein